MRGFFMSKMIDNAIIDIDLAIEARWIVPVVPHGQVLEKHVVILDDAVIVDILPVEQSRSRYRAGQVVSLDEHVLIPGLINLHTHAAMSLMRGLADDLPLMPWLQSHIWPAENQLLSERFVHDGTLLACAEMLHSGTTCFNDMYFFPSIRGYCGYTCRNARQSWPGCA